MKTKILSVVMFLFITGNVIGQGLSPKEKANDIAKNEFSKSKYKHKEKDGQVVDVKNVIESVPVAKQGMAFYEGSYVYKDLDYTVQIRTDKQQMPVATLKAGKDKVIFLKNVTVTDALFQAVKENTDGTNEIWEGVFINRNDNGNVEFGLGLKLPRPVQLSGSLEVSRIFMKKVSQ